jgi:hypothetical protein
MRYFGIGGRKVAPRSHVCAETSTMAISISRSGRLMFWLMISVGFFIFIGAICFVLFAAEPLWTRLLTFVVLGVVPCIVAYGSGWVMYWILQAVSISYDPIARRAEQTFCALTRTTVFSLRLSAKVLLTVIIAVKRAVHRFGAKCVRAWMILQKAGPFFRCLWSCVVESTVQPSRSIPRSV